MPKYRIPRRDIKSPTFLRHPYNRIATWRFTGQFKPTQRRVDAETTVGLRQQQVRDAVDIYVSRALFTIGEIYSSVQ